MFLCPCNFQALERKKTSYQGSRPPPTRAPKWINQKPKHNPTTNLVCRSVHHGPLFSNHSKRSLLSRDLLPSLPVPTYLTVQYSTVQYVSNLRKIYTKCSPFPHSSPRLNSPCHVTSYLAIPIRQHAFVPLCKTHPRMPETFLDRIISEDKLKRSFHSRNTSSRIFPERLISFLNLTSFPLRQGRSGENFASSCQAISRNGIRS